MICGIEKDSKGLVEVVAKENLLVIIFNITQQQKYFTYVLPEGWTKENTTVLATDLIYGSTEVVSWDTLSSTATRCYLTLRMTGSAQFAVGDKYRVTLLKSEPETINV